LLIIRVEQYFADSRAILCGF